MKLHVSSHTQTGGGVNFTLPTRLLENYKYTDFSRLLPGMEFEYIPPQKSETLPEVSPVFSQILASIDARLYPLARFALDYPSADVLPTSSKNNLTDFWKNKVVFVHVKAGESSSLTLEAAPPHIFLNILYVVLLEKGARLKVEVLTQSDPHAEQETTPRSIAQQIAQHIEVWQDADSLFEIFYENHGQAFGRYDLHAKLMGERAVCRAFGSYQCEQNDHVDHHLLMEHCADHTRSEQFFKGTADHQAHAIFNGKAVVHPKVKHADAKQHNFNLLLSPSAEIDTKPELEVFTDIVTAAHGATVGQLDEEALFYLESRGISPREARGILIEGFLKEVREKFAQLQF